MPSVMTIEGATPRCKYVIARGQYGRRKFKGCYRTKAEANRAAKRKGSGWMVVHSRPPGVPMNGPAERTRIRLPRWSDRSGWIGGSKHTLYVFTDTRTGKSWVLPVGQTRGWGPAAKVRVATRAEAEGKVKGFEGWQKKLHSGWKTLGLGSGAATHREQFQRGAAAAERHLKLASQGAAKNNCWKVWNNLVIARANTSHAYANLSSMERPTRADQDRYERLSKRMLDATDTIGWQCIRR